MTKGIANPHFEAGGLQIRRNREVKGNNIAIGFTQKTMNTSVYTKNTS